MDTVRIDLVTTLPVESVLSAPSAPKCPRCGAQMRLDDAGVVLNDELEKYYRYRCGGLMFFTSLPGCLLEITYYDNQKKWSYYDYDKQIEVEVQINNGGSNDKNIERSTCSIDQEMGKESKDSPEADR